MPTPPAAHGGPSPTTQRGLTLLEVLAALAVLAVLAAMALPSLGAAAQRGQLAAAAEGLAADLAEARLEAARSGQTLYVQSQGSIGQASGWCWSVATQPGCDCQASAAPACRLKAVRAHDHPGIVLLQPLRAQLAPQGAAQGTAQGGVQATELQSRQGDRLRVELAALGRSRVCAPAASAAGLHGRFAAC